ncbi:MAG: TolC family protein [Thermodesulfobacteria bacterium]|nr:TolC family protein [Thermodesulfobacteriota bacterium]
MNKWSNKNRPWFFALLFLWMLCTASPAGATGDEGLQPLSLHDAFVKALENNPMLQQAQATTKKADAQVGQAFSAFLPKVNLDLGYMHTNNPVMSFSNKLNQAAFTQADFQIDRLNHPDYRDNWEYKFVFMQPIFNQGQEYIGYKTSKLAKAISDLGYSQTAQSVLFMVEQAYCQALLAEEKVGVLRTAYKTASLHETLARRRYEAGLVLKSDLLSAQVQKTKVERQLFKAESDYLIALAALNNAMGVDQGLKWHIQRIDFESSDERELDYWLKIAKEHRPEYQMAQKQLKIADYLHKQALFKFLPSFNLVGIYQGDRQNLAYFGGDSWTLMANMTINIFNGFGDRAGVSAANADRQRAAARLRQVEQAIELEVRQAYYRFQTAKKQLKVARQAVKQAKESQKILRNRYSNGLALMVELLSADTTVKETSLEEAAARFDARLAWSELRRKAGVLGQDIIVRFKDKAQR